MRRSLVLVLLTAGLLAAGAPAAPGAGIAPREIDVMTFNIASAAFTGNDLEVLADTIAAEDPDVIGLQEVDHSWSRSDSLDQAVGLAARLGMNVAFGPAYDCVARDADDDGFCRYGVALLSRFPMVAGSVERIALPRADLGETRMLLRAVVNVRGRLVQVLTTHLAVEPASRRLQTAAVVRYLSAHPMTTVLTGDFNALSGAPELSRLRKRYRDAQQLAQLTGRTARGGRIDYVYASKGIGVLGARLGPAGFSDHRPLVAELLLPR